MVSGYLLRAAKAWIARDETSVTFFDHTESFVALMEGIGYVYLDKI